uniref:Tropomodulin n=1 Tax=Globodera rostochiensis TaxID=31243 RepID=A0A914HJ92_GLORO
MSSFPASPSPQFNRSIDRRKRRHKQTKGQKIRLLLAEEHRSIWPNMDAEEPVEDEQVMTDADFERAMEQLREEGGEDVNELLMAMSENRIISWEEAEHILGNSSNEPVKSSLPQQTRPTEPDNDTDVDWCVQRLLNNDPKLVEINLNNMKRTPIPKIKRVIEACRDNEHMEKLSLANMGLYDLDVQPLIDILEHNSTLRCVNLETNYLSGDFFARLFKAALTNQTLEEVKAVNQGVAFSTTAEREMIEAITENRGLTKVSINLRLPEGRFKIEQTMIRNQEIRRILRRQEAAAQVAAAEKAKGPLTTRPPKETEAKKRANERKVNVQELLARKSTPSKLAVAGAAAQPKAGSSASSPSAAEKSVLREKARDMEREAMKPKEDMTAERVLLSERLRETGVDSGVAARRAKFGEKASPADDKSDEKATKKGPKREEKKPDEAADKTKRKDVPSWREKLADRDAKAKELAEPVQKSAESPNSKKTPTAKSATKANNSPPPSKTSSKSPSKAPPAERKESKDSTTPAATTTTKKVPKKTTKPKDGTADDKGTAAAAAAAKSAAEKVRPETAPKATPTERAPLASWRDRMNAPQK